MICTSICLLLMTGFRYFVSKRLLKCPPKKTGEKRAYDDNLARPKFAIMNPEYMKSLPDYQTESGCTDIMMPVRKLCGRGALPIMTLPAAKKLNREDAIHIYQNARG